MILKRVFLAGTIQGANRGVAVEDQSYRDEIAALVTEFFPGCECFDPSLAVKTAMSDRRVLGPVLEMMHHPPEVIDTHRLPDPIAQLRHTFHDMTRKAGRCDLCIAYLPGRIPSMGTAMEMYSAHRAGVPVVAVTDMVENLAIISTASWVLRDLPHLRTWLSAHAAESTANS